MCTTGAGQGSASPHLDDVGLAISKLVKLFELEDAAVLLSDTQTRGFFCCCCRGCSECQSQHFADVPVLFWLSLLFFVCREGQGKELLAVDSR